MLMVSDLTRPWAEPSVSAASGTLGALVCSLPQVLGLVVALVHFQLVFGVLMPFYRKLYSSYSTLASRLTSGLFSSKPMGFQSLFLRRSSSAASSPIPSRSLAFHEHLFRSRIPYNFCFNIGQNCEPHLIR